MNRSDAAKRRAQRMKDLYGEDYYSRIGAEGGAKGVGGGFTGDPTAAKEAGAKGGAATLKKYGVDHFKEMRAKSKKGVKGV